MKKNHFFSFIILLFVSIFIFSCNKSEDVASKESISNTENDDQKRNEATWISFGPEKQSGFSFKLFVGHSAKDCGGNCIGFMGQTAHVDCRGTGNECNYNANAYFSTGPFSDELILTLIELDVFGTDLEFPFPNRSFYITNPQNNTSLWLNIPEQLLVRANSDEPFVLYNIWLSEDQDLENK